MKVIINQIFISFLFLTISLGGCGDFEGNYEEVEKSVSNSTDNSTESLNLFVAVGGSGTILTSPDGTSWTSRTSGTSQWLYDVSYGRNTTQF